MRAAAALAAMLVFQWSPGARAAAAQPAGAPVDRAGALAKGAGEPLEVAVSVPPQAWLVERLGGSHVRVTTMLSSGSSEHSVELRPHQLAALERARVYVRVGHPAFLLERQRLAPLLRRRPQVRVVDMAQAASWLPEEKPGLPADSSAQVTPEPQRAARGAADPAHDHAREPGDGHAHDHGESDPHLWLSPSVMEAAAAAVAGALEEADPAHAPDYRRNLQLLQQELIELDARIRAELAVGTPEPALPRRFLVYHPAWGYFAHEYGLQQVAIEAEGKEPSPMRLIQLIEQVRALGLTSVFVQRGISTRSARVIAREIGAHVVELDPMARDWKTAMLHAAREIGAALRSASAAAGSAAAGGSSVRREDGAPAAAVAGAANGGAR